MAALTERPVRIGDVLKMDALRDEGYTLELKTVTVVAGMANGAVLEETSVAGKATLVVTATAANASAILLDDAVYGAAVGTDVELACLVRGPAIVGDLNLSFGTITAPAKAIALAAIKAKGVLVRTQI